MTHLKNYNIWLNENISLNFEVKNETKKAKKIKTKKETFLHKQ